MAQYKGTITGTGNKTTRENEIMPDNVAVFRQYAISYKSGIVYDEGHDFSARIENTKNGYGNTVHLTDGMMFAYGYFAHAPAVDITFLPPAVEQWHIIYAELDRSVIPNTCTIKTKNNQGSNRIFANTFRQDELSIVKTGVYQIPLWLVHVTNKGIESLSRISSTPLVEKIGHVYYSDSARGVMSGGTLGENVTCEYPSARDWGTSKEVVNKGFVERAIKAAISGKEVLPTHAIMWDILTSGTSASDVEITPQIGTARLFEKVTFYVAAKTIGINIHIVGETVNNLQELFDWHGAGQYSFTMPDDDVNITIYLSKVE